jgi:hypothetical protein
MTDQSPFERPSVSQGYPLEERERKTLEAALERVREGASDQSPATPTTAEEGGRGS